MINKFLNILFPETCPVCSNKSDSHKTAPICRECWQSIHPYTGPICRKCGKPLVSEFALMCDQCLRSNPAFEYARSFGLYDGVLRKAIHLFKYHGVKRLAVPLSDIILKIKIPRADVVIPVPLHKKRLVKRGFNQSALLAKHIAEHKKMDLVIGCLVKNRDTSPQVGLRYVDRLKNNRQAFTIKDGEMIRNRDILLVDDVVTTGSTICECAKILKKSGAADIYVMSLAHGMSD